MVNDVAENSKKLSFTAGYEEKIRTVLFFLGLFFLFWYFILGRISGLVNVDSDNVTNYYLMIVTLLSVYSFQWATYCRFNTLSFYLSCYLIGVWDTILRPTHVEQIVPCAIAEQRTVYPVFPSL